MRINNINSRLKMFKLAMNRARLRTVAAVCNTATHAHRHNLRDLCNGCFG